MSDIVLAYAPEQRARAALITNKLRALGHEVAHSNNDARGPLARRALAEQATRARWVLVLWSRAARREPSLRVIAGRARALGNLAFARLDQAPAPVGLAPAEQADLSRWSGRADDRNWRALVARFSARALPAATIVAPVRGATEAPAAPAKKSGAAVWLLVIGLVLAAVAAAVGVYLFV